MSVDRGRLFRLLEDERRRFRETHPRSAELFAPASTSLLGGVPMTWMRKWAGGFPIFARECKGAHVVDADGHDYVDLCLGDTGAMAGHLLGPAGSASIREVILDRGVRVHIHGHIHACFGRNGIHSNVASARKRRAMLIDVDSMLHQVLSEAADHAIS